MSAEAVGFAIHARAGAREAKQIKDADPKACASTSRVEDADMRRNRASSACAGVVESAAP
jgi:hypothetical protein